MQIRQVQDMSLSTGQRSLRAQVSQGPLVRAPTETGEGLTAVQPVRTCLACQRHLT